MGFVLGQLPLDCNKPLLEYYAQIEKEKLGNTLEAKEWRKKEIQGAFRTANTKGMGAVHEEFKRYAGNIINTQIDMRIYAQTVVTSLFEVVNWTRGNIPAYSLRFHPELKVTRMSAHGEPPQTVSFMSESQYFPQPYIISTQKVYQPKPSILTGEVGPDEVINRDMADEISQTIEDDIWTLLAAAIGSWTVNLTWQYDTRIQGLPTTNSYDFSSEGGLTVGLFRKILAAVDTIPSRVRRNEPARIRNIFVPHTSMQDIRTWVSVVSNVSAGAAGSSNDNQTIVSDQLARQIESAGVSSIQSMWGENIGIRPVNRLMGTSSANFDKYLWVFLDEPVGRLMVCPEEDRSEVLMNHQPFEVGFMMWRTIALEIPTPWYPNFMLVQYKT